MRGISGTSSAWGDVVTALLSTTYHFHKSRTAETKPTNMHGVTPEPEITCFPKQHSGDTFTGMGAVESLGPWKWRKRRQLSVDVPQQQKGYRPWAGLGWSPGAINPSCFSPKFINGPTNWPVRPDGGRNEKGNRWRWTGGDAAGSGIKCSTPL